jgi:hypothetical protein
MQRIPLKLHSAQLDQVAMSGDFRHRFASMVCNNSLQTQCNYNELVYATVMQILGNSPKGKNAKKVAIHQ